jgi:hypothetical protein
MDIKPGRIRLIEYDIVQMARGSVLLDRGLVLPENVRVTYEEPETGGMVVFIAWDTDESEPEPEDWRARPPMLWEKQTHKSLWLHRRVATGPVLLYWLNNRWYSSGFGRNLGVNDNYNTAGHWRPADDDGAPVAWPPRDEDADES